MRIFRARFLFIGLAASLVTGLAGLMGQPVGAAESAGIQIEDRARRALLDMSAYLKSSKSYSFHADIQFDDVIPSGQKITFAAVADISLRRPNGIFASQVSDTGARRLWYDGKQLTLLDPTGNTFAVESLSGNSDQALEFMINRLHFNPPLADFLYEDPAKAMLRNTIHGFQVGMSPVDGVPCRHLAFVDALIDWQIWIQEGKLPLPKRLVITYKTLPGSPQYSARLSEWDFSSRLPDSLFQAGVPPGATRLPFMREGEATPFAGAGR